MLEAGDRVGGRVWSERLASGSIIERGAEFVLPGYETMRDLAARLGLTFREKGTLYGDRDPRDGPPVTRDDLLAAVAELRDANGAIARRGDRRPSGDRRRTQRDRLAARDLDCARARLTSRRRSWPMAPLASVLFRATASSAATTESRARLAASLDVRLGRRVEQVVWSDDGVTR